MTTRLRESSTDADSDSLVDDLIAVLESNDLSMGGGGDRVLEYVVSRDGGQATQADREIVLQWAERWTAIAEIDVSDLIDLQDG